MKSVELLQKIFEGGVVGAGGAGFPTHKKLVRGAELLIVNAAECEPLLCSDRLVMRRYADKIIDGLLAIQRELEIGRVVIGTKAKYTGEIAALQKAIAKRDANIGIHGVGSFYPAGDEQVLIYEITGKIVPPGGIPIALGIVVINVTTALNIHDAMGGLPVTHKFVTVTGAVHSPAIVRTPVGTAVTECIAAAGGAVFDDYTIVMGGPMMGKQHPKSREGELFIGKTDGGIILLPPGHPLPAFMQKPLEHIINQAKSVCIQCSHCTEQCPRYLIGHRLRPNRVMRAIATGTHAESLTEAMLCCECGICELYACPMGLSPRQVNMHIKDLIRKGGRKPEPGGINPDQAAMREYRRIAQSRLISRLDLRDYPSYMDNVLEYAPGTVSIALRHGIGRPASPVVAAGDRVKAGDLIAAVEFDDIGSRIHASIDGVITAVGDRITIVREEAGT